MKMLSALGAPINVALLCLASTALVGCPRPPDEHTVDTCAERTECGECVNQPHCGWCMNGDEGVCIGNTGETSPEVAPPSCDGDRSWRWNTGDSETGYEAPYCPLVRAPGAEDEYGGDGESSDDSGDAPSAGDEAAEGEEA